MRKTNNHEQPLDDSEMRDVTDGERFLEMKLPSTDLAVLIHNDGAKISKSPVQKMFRVFVQCVSVPLRLRSGTFTQKWTI